MISMYPDVKFRRIWAEISWYIVAWTIALVECLWWILEGWGCGWFVIWGLHSVESRVWGFVHALKIPSKCHMSSEQWAAGRLMLCDWGKNKLTSQKTNGGKPTTPVAVGCCQGVFFLCRYPRIWHHWCCGARLFETWFVEVVANMQQNIRWVWWVNTRCKIPRPTGLQLFNQRFRPHILHNAVWLVADLLVVSTHIIVFWSACYDDFNNERKVIICPWIHFPIESIYSISSWKNVRRVTGWLPNLQDGERIVIHQVRSVKVRNNQRSCVMLTNQVQTVSFTPWFYICSCHKQTFNRIIVVWSMVIHSTRLGVVSGTSLIFLVY